MTASVGIALDGKRKAQLDTPSSDESEPPKQDRLSISKITLIATGGLIVCSAVYHLVIMPRYGLAT